MNKLSLREILILVLTLTLAFFFIIFQYVIKPIHEGAANVDDRMRLVQEQLARSTQLVAQKQYVEDQYKNMQDQIGVVDSEEAQIPMIISKIESAARETNVHIANIQPQKSYIQQEAKFLSVEVEIDGQWLDVVRFISMLQQPPNFYFIDDLSLEQYSGANSSLRGRIVISLMSLVNH